MALNPLASLPVVSRSSNEVGPIRITFILLVPSTLLHTKPCDVRGDRTGRRTETLRYMCPQCSQHHARAEQYSCWYVDIVFIMVIRSPNNVLASHSPPLAFGPLIPTVPLLRWWQWQIKNNLFKRTLACQKRKSVAELALNSTNKPPRKANRES